MDVYLVVLIYGALLLGAFWVANSEHTKASEAIQVAQSARATCDALDRAIVDMREQRDRDEKAFREFVNSVIEAGRNNLKLKDKLEWLEMKVSHLPRASPSPRVVLSQDKPLRFTVITREGPPLKKKVAAQASTDLSKTQKEDLIKTIKKKVSELSQ